VFRTEVNSKIKLDMASLYKRANKKYYIIFSKTIDGKMIQKKFSLKTGSKKIAQRKMVKYNEMYESGEINPFNGWNPNESKSNSQKSNPAVILLKDLAEEFVVTRTQVNKITKRAYRRHLNMLMELVGQSMPVTRITEDHIRNFCFQPHLKLATQASYLRHINVFFNWLHKVKGITEKNVTENVRAPKVPGKLEDKVFRTGEIDKVFIAFDEYYAKKIAAGKISHKKQKLRWFKPLVNIAFFCGLRVSEVVRLRWEDINFVDQRIYVKSTDEEKTKSAEGRYVPIRKPLLSILIDWHKTQNQRTTGFLFHSPVIKNNHRNKEAVSKTFKKFLRLAGLPESRQFHGLRHTCVTELRRKGLDIGLVRDFVGHSSTAVTQIYEHLNCNDLKRSLDAIDAKSTMDVNQ